MNFAFVFGKCSRASQRSNNTNCEELIIITCFSPVRWREEGVTIVLFTIQRLTSSQEPLVWYPLLWRKLYSMPKVVSDQCAAVNGAGLAYREFSCDYPQLEPFYFEWVSTKPPGVGYFEFDVVGFDGNSSTRIIVFSAYRVLCCFYSSHVYSLC